MIDSQKNMPKKQIQNFLGALEFLARYPPQWQKAWVLLKISNIYAQNN